MAPADLPLLTTLFLSALSAGSILPAQSELVLAGMIAASTVSPVVLIAVASLGNVLGSFLNWLIGRSIDRFRDRKWFPATPEQMERASRWYRRWGHWTLLLAWVPVIGDPLTVIAGTLREPLWRFLVLVTIAKTGRYIAVAYAALALA